MPTHRCLDDRTLAAYLTGRLTEGETATIESTMDACSDCQTRCDAIERELAKQWQALFSPAKPTSDTFGSEPEVARVIQQILAPNSPMQHSACVFTETRVLADPGTPTANASNVDVDAERVWQARLKKIAPAEFLLRLRKSRLVTEQQLQQIAATPSDDSGAAALGAAGQARCGLTDWQLEQLAKGNTALLLDNGRYELRSQIGQGGMGAVYLARHRLMNREVALKVIDPRKVTNPQLIARFKREVEASSRLQHEHIVQALDVGQHGDVSFLVLEYVHGSDLASIVRRDGPLPADQAAAICLQAASALAYAHAQGVVHRDIKPQNILLSTAGVTKILDMGLARIANEGSDDHTSLTLEGTLMGTVNYMAPEQARDTRTADARSDLYSLGATLYYLLAGKPPFAGGTAIDKLSRLATELPPPLGLQRLDCPIELTQLVDRLLAKSPLERPASAQEVVRELRPFAAEKVAGRVVATASVQAAAEGLLDPADGIASPLSSVVFETPSALSMLRRKPQSTSWKLWGGLAALAATILAAASLTISRSPAPDQTGNPSATRSSSTQPPPVTPAQFTVDIGGHWGEDYSMAWLRPGGWLFHAAGSGDITDRYRGAISWSPDDMSLATANGDADIRIWSSSTGTTSFNYRAHPARVLDVVWGPDSRTLASCDLEGNVHVWNVGSREPLAVYRLPFAFPYFHMALSMVPDGRHLTITYCDPHTPKILKWNWTENRIVSAWSKYGDLVGHSPSGRFQFFWGRPYQGEVVYLTLVDNQTDTLLGPLQTDEQTPRPLGFTDDDRLLTLSADSTYVAAWEPTTGTKIAEHTLFAGDSVWGISRSNGRILIRSGEQLVTLELSSGANEFTTTSVPLSTSNVQNAAVCASSTLARGLVFYGIGHGEANGIITLPEGRRLCSCPVSPMRLQPIRELVSGRYLRLSQGVLDLESGDSWSKFPDVATVLADGRLRGLVGNRILEWPGVDRQNEPFRVVSKFDQFEEHETGRFTSDGQIIVSWTDRVRCRDVESGRLISEREYPDHRYQSGLDRSRDVEAWCTMSPSSTMALHIVREGEHPLMLDLPLLWDPNGIWNRIVVANNARYVLAATTGGSSIPALGEPKTAWLYDLQAADIGPLELQSLQKNYMDSLMPAFTPSGRFLYLTNEVWETESRRRVWVCPERSRIRYGYFSNTQSVAAMNDERRIVIYQDNQVQVWDWPTNRKLATVFWMPADQWALVNHVTGCWTGTDLATQYLRLGTSQSGGKLNWLTAAQFEKHTGWKNDSSRSGLATIKADDSSSSAALSHSP